VVIFCIIEGLDEIPDDGASYEKFGYLTFLIKVKSIFYLLKLTLTFAAPSIIFSLGP
jgi:hypothetical protein